MPLLGCRLAVVRREMGSRHILVTQNQTSKQVSAAVPLYVTTGSDRVPNGRRFNENKADNSQGDRRTDDGVILTAK